MPIKKYHEPKNGIKNFTTNVTNLQDSIESYIDTDIMESNKHLDPLTSQNHQTSSDRFRRKPFEANSQKLDIKANDIDVMKTIYSEEYDEKEIDNSMEKLRVDEETRTKIFHDFSTTVSKYPDRNISIEADLNELTVVDETDVYSEGVDMYGTLHDDIFGNDNESSVSPIGKLKSFPSHPPTTSAMKRLLPRIDGE